MTRNEIATHLMSGMLANKWNVVPNVEDSEQIVVLAGLANTAVLATDALLRELQKPPRS